MRTWKVAIISIVCGLGCLVAGFLGGYQQGVLQTSAYDISMGTAIGSLIREHNDGRALEFTDVLVGLRSGTFTHYRISWPGVKNTAWVILHDPMIQLRKNALKMAADYMHLHPDAKTKINPAVASFLEQQLPPAKS